MCIGNVGKQLQRSAVKCTNLAVRLGQENRASWNAEGLITDLKIKKQKQTNEQTKKQSIPPCLFLQMLLSLHCTTCSFWFTWNFVFSSCILCSWDCVVSLLFWASSNLFYFFFNFSYDGHTLMSDCNMKNSCVAFSATTPFHWTLYLNCKMYPNHTF